jgi:hypothetical protein
VGKLAGEDNGGSGRMDPVAVARDPAGDKEQTTSGRRKPRGGGRALGRRKPEGVPGRRRSAEQGAAGRCRDEDRGAAWRRRAGRRDRGGWWLLILLRD